MGGSDVPYDEVSSDELGAAAASSWTFRFDPPSDPDQVVLRGACPRCEHAFEYVWPLLLVRDESSLEQREDDDRITIPVVCRCEVAHPGADDDRGCGASWTLVVPTRS
jgi:hypothetical protein